MDFLYGLQNPKNDGKLFLLKRKQFLYLSVLFLVVPKNKLKFI